MNPSASDGAAGTAAAAPAASAKSVDDELSLAELLQAVHRRRWLLLGCIFLAGLAGMGAIAALTPVYDARALLIIEPDTGGRAAATVATPSQTPDSAAVDSQVQILGSRSLAREVLGQLDLAADPELTDTAAGGQELLTRLLPAAQDVVAPVSPGDVVGRFLERLTVKREGKSNVIGVAYRSTDPVKAALIANKLAELYMAGQLARKHAAAQRQTGWLDGQLQALKVQLDAAEAQLAGFRQQSEAARSDTYAADPAEIAGLNAQLVTATVARAAKEATLGRLRRLVETGDPSASLGELGSSAMLDNLMALKAELLRREAELAGQYGERHPRIQDIRAEKAQARWPDPRRAPGAAAPVRRRGRPRPGRRAGAGGPARRAEGQGGAPRGHQPANRRSWSARSSSIGASTRPISRGSAATTAPRRGRSPMRG